MFKSTFFALLALSVLGWYQVLSCAFADILSFYFIGGSLANETVLYGRQAGNDNDILAKCPQDRSVSHTCYSIILYLYSWPPTHRAIARLAQSVERQTLTEDCDLKAAGSTPASGYSYTNIE